MSVRVLRIIEYVYEDLSTANEDMSRWTMNTPPSITNKKLRMSSAVVSITESNLLVGEDSD